MKMHNVKKGKIPRITFCILCLVFCIFLILLASGVSHALTATNLSVYPNPVSTALHDHVTITFVLSETPTGTVETLVKDQVVPEPDGGYAAGMNKLQWTPNLSDGTYEVKVQMGGTTLAVGSLTIDSIPPEISDVTVSPSPFSPNGDGINDYCEITFTVSGLGGGVVGAVEDQDGDPSTSDWDWSIGPDNSGIPQERGARILVSWLSSDLTQDTIGVTVRGEYKGTYTEDDISINPNAAAVTAAHFTSIDGIIPSTDPNVADMFVVDWVSGEVSVNVYTQTGVIIDSLTVNPDFAGDRLYHARWGGTLGYADGEYILRIQTTDAARNVSRHSNVVILDNGPIRLSKVSAFPTFQMVEDVTENPDGTIEATTTPIVKISPQSEDGIADIATINYYLSEDGHVTARIYDAEDNIVVTLKADEEEMRGNHSVVWDGKDEGSIVVSADDEGTYTCVITAVDAATLDETAELAVPVMVDNQEPDTPTLQSIESPTNAAYVYVSGTGEPGAKIKIYLNSVLVGTMESFLINGEFPAPGWDPATGELTPASPFRVDLEDEGPATIKAKAVDEAGNESPDAEMEIVVDWSDPSVTDNVSPHWYSVSPVSAVLRASDGMEGSGVIEVYARSLNALTGESVSLKFESGSVKIHAQYYTGDTLTGEADYVFSDGNNNDGDGQTDEEIYNGIDDDSDGLIDEDLGPYFTAGDGQDDDEDGSIDEETANGLDDDGDGEVDEDIGLAGALFPTALPVIFTQDGVYALEYYARDAAGNTGSPVQSTNRVSIDTTPPQVTVDDDPSSGILVVKGSASDSLSGVRKVEARVKFVEDPAGNWEQAIGTALWSYSFNPPVNFTSPTVDVRVTDVAGNTVAVMNIVPDYTASAQTEVVMVLPNGRIRLMWSGLGVGPFSIYRDTSPLEGRDLTELTPLISGLSGESWIDEGTTDGTQYYYAIVNEASSSKLYAGPVIADKTAPDITNIAAVPSPFSPNGDRVEDSTRIFFTLTENTLVTMNVYYPDPSAPGDEARFVLVKKVLDGEAHSPGDNIVEWDGYADYDYLGTGAELSIPEPVQEGRYVYRFEKLSTTDEAGNTLLQSISGDIWVLLGQFEIRDISVTPSPFSPDGDKINDLAYVSYVLTDNADYVAGNVFAITDGEQEIVARIHAECLDYYWDSEKWEWTSFHVSNGVRQGLSSMNYFIKPINPKNGDEPPFHVSVGYPYDALTLDAYLLNYQAANPNWVPVSYDLVWNGSGARDGVSTYIIRLEASKASGTKTLAKTHEIFVETPDITPNDKTPPRVVRTEPRAGSVYSPIDGLSYVKAYLDDGQGTGVDLVNSQIYLLGENGEAIPGRQSNDGKSAITWRLSSNLSDRGRDDGKYAIVVSTMDFAGNEGAEQKFEFEYKAGVNDTSPPSVVKLDNEIPPNPDLVAVAENGVETYILADGSTVIQDPPPPPFPINTFRVKIVDDGSGVDLAASEFQLVKLSGDLEVAMDAEKVTGSLTESDGKIYGTLFLKLRTPLALDGSSDGIYLLRIRSVDVAKNPRVEEFTFKFKTMEDTTSPTIDAVSLEGALLDSDGHAIWEIKDSVAPFDLGALSGTVTRIKARASDELPSAGICLAEAKSYIQVTGPSGVINGVISYEGEARDAEAAYVDIVFTPDLPLVNNGVDPERYDVKIVAEDNEGNDKAEAAAGFELVSILAVNDVEPPLVEDVFVVRHDDEVTVDTLDLLEIAADKLEVWQPDVSVTVNSPRIAGPVCQGRYPYVADAESVWVTLNDEGAGVDTELSSVRLIEPDVRLLFAIESGVEAIQNGLNSGTVSSVLEQAFQDSGNPLTDNVLVLIEEEAHRWLIDDIGSKRMYTVKRELPLVKGAGGISEVGEPLLRIYERFLVNGEITAGGFRKAYVSLTWPVPLGLNGWYALDVLAVDNVKKLLFTIDLDSSPYAAELDHGVVSGELRQEFDNESYTLPDNVSVSVEDEGCVWIMQLYNAQAGAFDVYGSGGCRWRVIDDQGIYLVERENWKDPGTGEIESRLRVYSSNATTVLIPNAFFLDTAPPVIESVRALQDGEPIVSTDGTFDGVSASIRENGSGINYGATGIVLKDENGVVIPGSMLLSLDEADDDVVIATWLLEAELSLYDSYIVEIQTEDMAGNQADMSADLRSVTSRGEPEQPVVSFVFPDAGVFRDDMEDNEIPVFGPVIDKVTVRIEDIGSVGIDLEESSIKVREPAASDPYWWDIDGYQTYDEAEQTLTWNFKQSLPTDGRADGEYRTVVRVRDSNGLSRRYDGYFIYDSAPPEVIDVRVGLSSKPVGELVSISTLKYDATDEPLSRVSVKLRDDLSGPDLFNSSVEIIGPNGALNVSQTNDGVDTLLIEFPPFATDGQDDGVYQINISAVDNVGNQNPFPYLEPYSYVFTYDTQPPEIACVFACDGDDAAQAGVPVPPETSIPLYGACADTDAGEKPVVISKMDRVKVKLADAGVGFNLLSPDVKISVSGPRGPVRGRKFVGDDDDILYYVFDNPLSTADSSDDGDYTVRIEMVDLLGNETVLEFTFEYRALVPVLVDIEVATDDGEVFSLTKDDTKQFERSVTEVRAILEDRSGTGLDLDSSFIVVQGPGEAFHDESSNDGEDTLIYRFAEPLGNDSSDDGRYDVLVRAIDNAGHWAEYRRAFYFDNTPPEIVSVMVGGYSAKQTHPLQDDSPIPVLNGLVSEVKVKLADAIGGVDLFESMVTLSGPISMSTAQVNNGVDTITLRFFELPQNGTADGLYEISVEPVDILGNDLQEPVIFSFVYDTKPPEVVSTEPGNGDLVTTPVQQVIAVLSDGMIGESAGVDLAASSLVLIGPDGREVAGEMKVDVDYLAADQARSPLIVLSWDSVLREDSVTGISYYVVTGEIKNISNSLKEGVKVNISSYDANGVMINTKSSVPSETENRANSPTGIVRPQATVTPEDIPPGETATFVVWIEALGDEESFKVKPLYYESGEEEEEAGPDTSVIAFVLASPLSVDGTDDGTYTMNIVTGDLIGNKAQPVLSSFSYSTISPTVLSTRPADSAMLNTPVSSVKATLRDNSGAGLDLVNSRITLISPDGNILPGTYSSQGADTVVCTLNNVLATDGSADGVYVMNILAVDSTGRSASYKATFVYDRTAPVARLTFPAHGDVVVESIDQVFARLADAGTGVDLENSKIELIGPKGSVTGEQVNDGVDTIKLKIDPLATDPDAFGKYTINVTPADKVGNIAFQPQTFSFVYDAAAPVVRSTQPGDGETVITPINRVSAQLSDENGVGIDLKACELHLYGPDGQEISGAIRNDGANTLTLSFHTLAADGSANGEYTMTVVTQDLAGNRCGAAGFSLRFTYLPNAPGLASTIPENGALLSSPVSRVEARVDNKSGSGIDFQRSWIKLWGPDDQAVRGNMSHNGVDTLFFIPQKGFATDGMDDGEYTIEVKAVDKDGYESPPYRSKFTYDTTPPELVLTVPEDGAIINKPISEVAVTLADAMTGVDLFGSEVTLDGPVSVAGKQVNNGVGTIYLRFPSLPDDGTADGRYEISIKPVDVLGNDLPEPLVSSFMLDTTPPEVSSTTPSRGEIVTARPESISVVLTDATGVNPDACSIILALPDGQEKSGIIEPIDSASLITHDSSLSLRLVLSPEDISADGTYTIKVITGDLAGNVSAPVLVSFNYVVSAPAVISTNPADGAQFRTPISFVEATLKDNSGAGLDLGSSKITLIDPSGKTVSGTHSSKEAGVIRLDMQKGFATDGNDDGLYTMRILAVDKTGVSFSYETTFVYDTAPPVVKLVSPANGSVMKENIDYVSAQLEDSGVGVDLGESVIALIDSGNKFILGTQVNDGASTLKYKISALPGDGKYSILVIPVDKVGNSLPEALILSFVYDTTGPFVVKAEPADGSVAVVSLDKVKVQLGDDGSGVDLKKSGIQLFRPDGSQIPGIREENANTLTLSFPALSIDGSDNGEYTVTVVAQDLVGNVMGGDDGDDGVAGFSLRFTYQPTAPNLVSLTPKDGSFTAVPVERVEARLGDKSGSGIDFKQSSIRVLTPDGQEVPDKASNNGSDTLTLDLSGAAGFSLRGDGRYIVEVRAVDNKGNEATYRSSFLYDTTPPAVSQVYVECAARLLGNGITLGASDLTIIPYDFGPIDKITAVISDAGAGVDLRSSIMSLQDSSGAAIEAVQRISGADTVILEFDAIEADGIYTVTVDPKDTLGNGHQKKKAYRFMVDNTAPEIAFSKPASGSSVVNVKLSEITVQLVDNCSGIDPGTAAIQVSGPNGEIAGKLMISDSSSLITHYSLLITYQFDAPLSMDGRSDGDYLAKISYADKAGNGVADFSLRFTYDTIQPGGPIISNLGVFPRAFSPNDDGVYDSTTISYVLSKDAAVRLLVCDSSSITLLDSVQRPAGLNSMVWDSSSLPDGEYVIKIDAVDDRGLTGAVESASVTIDTHPPSVDRPVVSNNPFTPDQDGFADTTTISFAISGSEKVPVGQEPRDSVFVTIHDQSVLGHQIASLNLNRHFSGDGEYSATWDGGGAESDGEYTYIITARDVAGNIREVSGTLALDKSGPTIEVLTPQLPALSSQLSALSSPIVLSGIAADWNGVRSVALTGSFIPQGATDPVKDPINNWVQISFSGDKIDNDGDGKVDEEQYNDRDDDRDGLIDEDLAGKDEISAPVNWVYSLEPPTDGQYLITFRAFDSINHSSVTPQALKIVYDASPPLHIGTTSDVSTVRNGESFIITTKWDQPGYKVMVNLSQLDSTSSEPVQARDIGSGTYIVNYAISNLNTQSDGLKTIAVTAEDAVGNKTTLGTFRIRLRNDLPVIVSMSSPDGRTAFDDGSLVRILVECDASDLVVSADFTELDSNYTPNGVRVRNNGDNTYLVEYTISEANTVADRQDIPVIVSASAISFPQKVSSKYTVSLDNTAPQIRGLVVKNGDAVYEVPVTGESNGLMVFANGDVLGLETQWDGNTYTVSADFSELDSTYTPGDEDVTQSEFVYNILYEINRSNRALDGEKRISVKAIDAAGNLGQFDLLISLDNTAPAILSVTSPDKDNLYKNGDTVTLLVKLGGEGSLDALVSADFSELDSTYASRIGEVRIAYSGDGVYTAKYTISDNNTKASSGIVSNIHIPVTATDQMGNASADSSMVVKLDNLPPKLEVESPVSGTGVLPASSVKAGLEPVRVSVTEARIQIRGKTDSDAIVTVEPRITVGVPSEVPVKNGEFSTSVALKIGENIITVTAADPAGNETAQGLIILYRPLISHSRGGTIYLPERKYDGVEGNDTKVIVPPDAAKQDISIEITLRETESVSPAVDNPGIGRGIILPLIAYEFTVKDIDQVPLSMTFSKPVSIHLQYQDLDKLNGPAMVFRWDGAKWSRIGGARWDKANETVEVEVNSLSIFAIFEVAQVPTEFKLSGAFPNPFTPNSDGINDVVSFYFDNPNNAEAVIRIFDLRGALIRKLEGGSTSWDGLDDVGQSAEMGVYIYQIEVEDKVEGNTIVLAR